MWGRTRCRVRRRSGGALSRGLVEDAVGVAVGGELDGDEFVAGDAGVVEDAGDVGVVLGREDASVVRLFPVLELLVRRTRYS